MGVQRGSKGALRHILNPRSTGLWTTVVSTEIQWWGWEVVPLPPAYFFAAFSNTLNIVRTPTPVPPLGS